MSLLANSNAIESGGYNIDRSLRFRSSASAYLNKLIGAGGSNTKHVTSFWMKRGTITPASYMALYSAYQDANNYIYIYIGTTDKIGIYWVSSGSAVLNMQSTMVLRDPSAWYHVYFAQDTTQATAANRFKIWINGVEITSWSTNTNTTTQNNGTPFGGNFYHNIGRNNQTSSNYFDGYIAEFNDIWQPSTIPSVTDFGQTDAVTGVWTPKKYTGTYGTNGFYLPFSDNTSATTLAYDKSGNGNNWTPNNISTTAGATYDSMTDVPTLTSATAANYCVLNPLDKNTSATVADGNLKITSGAAANYAVRSTIQLPSTGKWYAELIALQLPSASNDVAIGVCTQTATLALGSANTWMAYLSGTQGVYNQTTQNTTAAWSALANGDVLQVAYDADNNQVWFGKNNVWLSSTFTNTGNPSAGTNPTITGLSSGLFFIANAYNGSGAASFGQRPFSYTPPTGFVALNTFNLPDPTIKKPNQYMDATLYTGTGATQSITNAAGFQPDFVWVKGRSGATDHALYDAVRGVQKQLESNTTTAETTETTGLTAFNSNGFSVGALAQMNTNAATYVGWQWKESATAGFDIVTYTGTGSNTTVAHSLGVAPKMIIVKNRDNGTEPWFVYHASANASPATGAVFLNQTTAFTTGATYWNNTAPTASVFSVGTNTGTNQNTSKMLAYLFAEIAGFSKFGSYSGNASTDGVFVYCGFRPEYVMAKRSSTTSSWYIYDAARNTYNQAGARLFADSSAVEATDGIDFLSNGFKLRDAGGANSAGTWIFAAFAQNPFKFANAR